MDIKKYGFKKINEKEYILEKKITATKLLKLLEKFSKEFGECVISFDEINMTENYDYPNVSIYVPKKLIKNDLY